jgi:uncharacterized RDD family membrane protein YckC
VSAELDPPVYAGLVTRGIAFVIDAVLVNTALVLLSSCVAFVVSVVAPDVDLGLAGVLAGVGAWAVAAAVYFVAFWTLTGQTVGMRVMRLRVTVASGARPGLGRALIRLAGMWLAAIPLMAGYALILFDRRRQGLQDKLAGTFVCHVAAPEAAAAATFDGGVHAPMAAHPRASLPPTTLRGQTASDLSIDREEHPA